MNQKIIDAITEWWLRLRLTIAVIAASSATACGPLLHIKPSTILVPCHAPAVARPDFPADHVTADDIWTQTKALLSDREVRKGYEAKLEGAVEACR